MTDAHGAAPAATAAPTGGALATAASVTWHCLVLRGFGPFRDEVRVEFAEGLTNFVAPNEFGKSTLVEGIAAVVFGLPGSSDPAAFGQARCRHWSGAARFEGEVEFTAADGQRYRVWRDFDGHRVRLERLGSGREVIFDSTHNPKAQRRSVTYEDRLRALIGIASRELFTQTFCVRQPLPEMPQLPAEIQSLLSGAGGGTAQAALPSLLRQLQDITKRKGDLGVANGNDNADRPLERLEQEIKGLDESIQAGAQAADELQQVRSRLAELSTLRSDLSNRLEAAERAWQEWLRLADNYANQARRPTELKGDLAQARQIASRVQEAEERLAREWPEMEGEPEETGARLERLVQIEQRLKEKRQERDGRVRQLHRAWGRAALAVWERCRAQVARLAELGVRLQSYEPLGEAEPETLALLRDFDREKGRLEREVQQARTELERAQERRNNLEEPGQGSSNHLSQWLAKAASQIA